MTPAPAALASASTAPAVLARYPAQVATVRGSEGHWWTGAAAGRGSESARTALAVIGSGPHPGE